MLRWTTDFLLIFFWFFYIRYLFIRILNLAVDLRINENNGFYGVDILDLCLIDFGSEYLYLRKRHVKRHRSGHKHVDECQRNWNAKNYRETDPINMQAIAINNSFYCRSEKEKKKEKQSKNSHLRTPFTFLWRILNADTDKHHS